ncbi:Rieske (2Fe-2S) protein [Streptomyces roseifaciens]|uniref:Rieske (2Fe-2S) protein n=1 Tax=Streptomyces roseifaciens TaxID=1488406 RepID=UPI00099F5AA7|nr:Rieske (2Fe-2S) protein [Streptomyces roseifaciens]
MNHTSRTASTDSADSAGSPGSGEPSVSPAPRGSTRRSVVAAAGAAGLVTVLAACGGGGDGGKDEGGDGKGDGKGDGELAKAADIPEGGGKVFPDRKVVVTQPVKGEFKAFSAVCTHQGCVVKDVSGGTINCPCHGSRFRIVDGSVQGGPAQGPLPEEQVSVRGGSLHLG